MLTECEKTLKEKFKITSNLERIKVKRQIKEKTIKQYKI